MDNADFEDRGAPAKLFVSAYDVAGQPVRGGLLTVVALDTSTAVEPLATYLDANGQALVSDLNPGHYSITLEALTRERQIHELSLTAARTDSICFVMRSDKVPQSFRR